MLYSEKAEIKKDSGSMDGIDKSTVNTDIPINVLLHACQHAHIKEAQFLYAKMSKRKVCGTCVNKT
jgi:hypothetical protein